MTRMIRQSQPTFSHLSHIQGSTVPTTRTRTYRRLRCELVFACTVLDHEQDHNRQQSCIRRHVVSALEPSSPRKLTAQQQQFQLYSKKGPSIDSYGTFIFICPKLNPGFVLDAPS